MSSERFARFNCPACGAIRLSTAMEYDDFGYPVCPECRYVAGPDSGEWVAEPDETPTDWTWVTSVGLADAEPGRGFGKSNGTDSSGRHGEYGI